MQTVVSKKAPDAQPDKGAALILEGSLAPAASTLPVSPEEWRELSFADLKALSYRALCCPELAPEIQAGLLQRPVLAARVILYNQDDPLRIVLREVQSGLLGVPGGKVRTVSGADHRKCLESPDMSALRELAEEVLPGLEPRLADPGQLPDLLGELKPFTILVAHVEYPQKRWGRHGINDPAWIIETGTKEHLIANASTIVFSRACFEPLCETVQGRKVREYDLRHLNLVEIRPQHRELLAHYREVQLSSAAPAPFVLHHSLTHPDAG